MLYRLPKVARGLSIRQPEVPASSNLAQSLDLLAAMPEQQYERATGLAFPAMERVLPGRGLFGDQPFTQDSFSDREVLRMTGELPMHRIEALLDKADHWPALQNVDRSLYEAERKFPAEDIMSGVVTELIELATRMKRGSANEVSLMRAISRLQSELTQAVHDAEYSAEQIESARRTLFEAGLTPDTDKPQRSKTQ